MQEKKLIKMCLRKELMFLPEKGICFARFYRIEDKINFYRNVESKIREIVINKLCKKTVSYLVELTQLAQLTKCKNEDEFLNFAISGSEFEVLQKLRTLCILWRDFDGCFCVTDLPHL